MQAGTNASPMRRVPSVKILAIRVDFSEFRQVQKLPSFLGCFPNIEILHVEVTIFMIIQSFDIFIVTSMVLL